MLWHLSFFIYFFFFPALSVNTKILSFVSFTESIAVMVPDTKAQRLESISKSIFDFYPFHMNMCAQLEDRKRGEKALSFLIKHLCMDASRGSNHASDFSKIRKVERVYFS